METFKSLLAVLEALPTKLPDDKPLRDVMPGAWPTVGDLRKLVDEQIASSAQEAK